MKTLISHTIDLNMVRKIYISLVSVTFLTTSCGLNSLQGNGVPFGWECRNIEITNTRTGYLVKEYIECREERGKSWLKSGKYKEYYDGYDLAEEANYKIIKSKEKEEKFISVLDGKAVGFYRNGQLMYREKYTKGKKTGLWEEWHNNGNLSAKGEYIDGKKTGLWERWYYNGELQIKEEYIDGKKTGLWEQWHNNGNLSAKGEYIDGKKTGLWEEWYYNGELKTKGEYIDDKKTGLWEEW